MLEIVIECDGSKFLESSKRIHLTVIRLYRIQGYEAILNYMMKFPKKDIFKSDKRVEILYFYNYSMNELISCDAIQLAFKLFLL